MVPSVGARGAWHDSTPAIAMSLAITDADSPPFWGLRRDGSPVRRLLGC